MEKAVSLVMSTSVSMLPRSIGKATEMATDAVVEQAALDWLKGLGKQVAMGQTCHLTSLTPSVPATAG